MNLSEILEYTPKMALISGGDGSWYFMRESDRQYFSTGGSKIPQDYLRKLTEEEATDIFNKIKDRSPIL